MMEFNASLRSTSRNTSYVLCAGGVKIAISLDRSLKVSDEYTYSLYNDQLMLLCYAKTGDLNVTRVGCEISIVFRTSSLKSGKNTLWLPGNYVFLMGCPDNTAIRFDLELNAKGIFTFKQSRQCAPMTDEAILAGRLFSEVPAWQDVSLAPGMSQLKRWVMERAKRNELNEFRGRETRIEYASNMLIMSKSRFTHTFIKSFMDSAGLGGTLYIADCSRFCDKTLNNPYEEMGKFFESSDKVRFLSGSSNKPLFYFYNIGTLTGSGGGIILKEVMRHFESGRNLAVFHGTREEVNTLLAENPSLQSFFPAENRIAEEPYTKEEVICSFFRSAVCKGLRFSPEAAERAYGLLSDAYMQGLTEGWDSKDISDCVERHLVPFYCSNAIGCVAKGLRVTPVLEVQSEDVSGSLKACFSTGSNDALTELDSMVGLTEIKRSIKTLANRLRFYTERRQLGLPTADSTPYHAVFTGNPGTGKTTVAKLLGKVYHRLGILSKGDVICADRSRMVGKWIGETEENMCVILREARGNVLFVDEAYTLYSNPGSNDFGRNAVESLLDVLSRKNPDMVIIFAGYEREMDRLMSMNPGLSGRFPYKFHFPDYSAAELLQIAQGILARDQYVLTPSAEETLVSTIRETVARRSPRFANARWIEQYVCNGIIPALADRLASSPHLLARDVYQKIEPQDVSCAYAMFSPRATELTQRRAIGFTAR